MRLFVFDGDVTRDQVVRDLEGLGADVSGTSDLEMALQTCYAEPFDLLVLGIGPGFSAVPLLSRLRQSGSTTPAVLITSEAKATLLGGAIRLGVSEIVMRPVDAAAFRARVAAVVAKAALTHPEPHAAAPASPDSAPPPIIATAPRLPRDILVVAGDPEMAETLRPLVPEAYSVDTPAHPPAALGYARESRYRVVLVDFALLSLHQRTVIDPLRALQEEAAFLGLSLRSKADHHDETVRARFRGHLDMPFRVDAVNEILFDHLGWTDVLARDGEVLRPRSFPGKSAHVDRYYQHLIAATGASADALAAACFEHLVLDLGHLPPHATFAAELVEETGHHAQRLGLAFAVAAPPALVALLRAAPGMKDFTAYPTVEAARAAMPG